MNPPRRSITLQLDYIILLVTTERVCILGFVTSLDVNFAQIPSFLFRRTGVTDPYVGEFAQVLTIQVEHVNLVRQMVICGLIYISIFFCFLY